MTDSTGAVRAGYDFDVNGVRSKLLGDLDADEGYTGLYHHTPSDLDLAVFRAYNPLLGRWISRDPIAEEGGTNLYRYAMNDPIDYADPSGFGANVNVSWNGDTSIGMGPVSINMSPTSPPSVELGPIKIPLEGDPEISVPSPMSTIIGPYAPFFKLVAQRETLINLRNQIRHQIFVEMHKKCPNKKLLSALKKLYAILGKEINAETTQLIDMTKQGNPNFLYQWFSPNDYIPDPNSIKAQGSVPGHL
jgi:RHS repeat-associated protein